jgi:soluble lytic murein transglycosylase-like protein
VLWAVIAMMFCATAAGAAIVDTVPGGAASPVQPVLLDRPQGIEVLDLSSVRRLFDATGRQRTSSNEAERAASWQDLSLLVEAVLGEPQRGPIRFDPARAPRVIPTAQLTARDTAAYQLLSLGYSARETADVVSGRISRRALDTAQRMLMAGRGREAAANYLDREYKSSIAPSNRPDGHEDEGAVFPRRFAAVIEKYATLRHVGIALVRAIIVVESAFDPGARSPAGAIGLMQLMPATARELGVDPSSPEQNIEGGVRYLAELIEMFGGIELALVAYNGGPGFARRYARGATPMYGETRAFVRKVLALAEVRR